MTILTHNARDEEARRIRAGIDAGRMSPASTMDSFTTIEGEKIVVTSIVEETVTVTPRTIRHLGWGIVEGLYAGQNGYPDQARVRDLGGQVVTMSCLYLKLSTRYPQPGRK